MKNVTNSATFGKNLQIRMNYEQGKYSGYVEIINFINTAVERS